jgi:ABC-type nitrate/sulfonate/bicarbonate transport system substrate-binding protein
MAGVAGPAVNLVYAYLAQDAGLWRKHGLDVRVILFEAGSTLAQVARTGEVSFAINSGPTTIASRTQGADSIIVAAMVNTLPYSLVTTKSITKWEQLKGKKVGISRFGSGTDTAIRLVSKRFGLDPMKDFIILQGGTQPSRLQALLAGSLDATLVSPPLDLTAKKQGLNILVNIADLGIAYPQLVIETSERFNREQPQQVKRLSKGLYRSDSLRRDEQRRNQENHHQVSQDQRPGNSRSDSQRASCKSPTTAPIPTSKAFATPSRKSPPGCRRPRAKSPRSSSTRVF